MTTDRRTILAVDDTPQNLDILVGLLRDKYRVKVAPDGKLALKVARGATPPDLILLDIMMPNMDGFEVCRRLKSDPTLREIPVIFISALTETLDKVTAFAVGGVDYVTKPFQAKVVEARVATHLRLREQQLEIEAQKQQLQDNYDKLRELEKLRDNLVHMIVHDMRSPLMGINGMLEIIKMQLADTLDDQLVTDFDEALTSGHSLQEMVSSLLDISRMESGEMPLERTAVDLRTVASDALTSLVSLVKQCNVVYEPPAEPVDASCDREITRRIIANLVSNAIKFTPRKGEVRIEFMPQPDGVKVTVSDTGPGIPPDYRERIFEKFGQVEGRQEGRKYSTGLGLTFCKLAVEAHGGRIGVDSEEGKGSTFWFTLP